MQGTETTRWNSADFIGGATPAGSDSQANEAARKQNVRTQRGGRRGGGGNLKRNLPVSAAAPGQAAADTAWHVRCDLDKHNHSKHGSVRLGLVRYSYRRVRLN